MKAGGLQLVPSVMSFARPARWSRSVLAGGGWGGYWPPWVLPSGRAPPAGHRVCHPLPGPQRLVAPILRPRHWVPGGAEHPHPPYLPNHHLRLRHLQRRPLAQQKQLRGGRLQGPAMPAVCLPLCPEAGRSGGFCRVGYGDAAGSYRFSGGACNRADRYRHSIPVRETSGMSEHTRPSKGALVNPAPSHHV